ncbi:MAG: tetratricopeptide repeat protein [Bacteroidia bacterium]|jgi:TolA-binding protein|nr:tetratricopeptide repeat protein [Bacteroidia bacterium]
MKKLLPTLGIFAAAALMNLFTACGGNSGSKKDNADSLAVNAKARTMYLDNITAAEKRMREDKTYSSKTALEALKAYTDFTTLYPKDSLTPDYLFKAAQVAQSTGNYQQAAVYFETIIDQHKGYKMYVEACFLAANNYDDHLENVNNGAARAKQLYEFIIAKYPDTNWAEQSKVLMSYIGKSNEQLMEDIIKKNEEKVK